MKKLLIIAAVAALALTACQKVNKMEEEAFQEGFSGTEIRVPVTMDSEVLTKTFSYLDYDHRNDTQGYDWSPAFFNNDGTSNLVGLFSVDGAWSGVYNYLNNSPTKPSYLEKSGDKYELVMNLYHAIDGGEGYSHFLVGFNAKPIGTGSNSSYSNGSDGAFLRFNLPATQYQTSASASHLDGKEPIYATGSINRADGTAGQDFKFHHLASLFRIYVKNTGTFPLTVSKIQLEMPNRYLLDCYGRVILADTSTGADVPDAEIVVDNRTTVNYQTVVCSDPDATGWNTIAPGEIGTFYLMGIGRTDIDMTSKTFNIVVYDQTANAVNSIIINCSDIAATTGVNHFLAGYAYNFSIKSPSKSVTVDGINYRITTGTNVEVSSSSPLYQQETVTIPATIQVGGVTYTVEGIGGNAFSQSPNLKKVTISEGVRYIGANAFTYCDNLEEIILPSTIHEINEYNGVFSKCPKLSISFSSENPEFHVDERGVLYGRSVASTSYKNLFFLPPKLTGDYTIEDGTTHVVSEAIFNPSFSSLTFPRSIKRWSGHLFEFYNKEPNDSYRLIFNWNAEELSAFYYQSSSISNFYFRLTSYPYSSYFDRFIIDVPADLLDDFKALSIFKDTTYDSTGSKHFTWATH
ncbi:MAG: leucine-rich repeat domain-containing protein [Bacteroidales bacterium]|nr:leucine-rich repeat domain-containing protein [Bacteroidales bacterium]